MLFVLNTAVASLDVASCSRSVSGKTTGKMCNKSKDTEP